MAGLIPTQTPFIAASTPQYTALYRLNISITYTLFVKTFATIFSITHPVTIGRLVPNLRRMHTPGPWKGHGVEGNPPHVVDHTFSNKDDWQIQIGEGNVSDALEWLKMRGGEAFVSVTLKEDDRSLAWRITRVKPSPSPEAEMVGGPGMIGGYGNWTRAVQFPDLAHDREEDSDDGVGKMDGPCNMDSDSSEATDNASDSYSDSDWECCHPSQQAVQPNLLQIFQPPQYGRRGRHGCGISYMRRE